MIRASGPIDVHVISHEEVQPEAHPIRRRGGSSTPSLSPRRRAVAWALAVGGPILLTVVLAAMRSSVNLPTDLLLFLLLTVVVAAIGGIGPALVAAVGGFLLGQLVLHAAVAHVHDRGRRQHRVARRLRGDRGSRERARERRCSADTRGRGRARPTQRRSPVSRGAVAAGEDPLPEIVAQLRELFAADAVAVLRRSDDHSWSVEVVAGEPAPARPEDASVAVPLRSGEMLVVNGAHTGLDDPDVLGAFASQVAAALERRMLRAAAAHADRLAESNALRTALLAAVSHDLRTPLSSIKASVTSLLQHDVDWPAETRREFLEAINSQTDRLNTLVGNLLDMSRLQTGAVDLTLRPVAVDEVVAGALVGLADRLAPVEVDVPETLPPVKADPALLERAFANLVGNAIQWSPNGVGVRVGAGVVGDHVELRVIDRGPGIPPSERERIFLPFQRLGDQARRRRPRACRRAWLRRGDGRGAVGRGHLRGWVDDGRHPPCGVTGCGVTPTRVLVVDDEPQIRRALAINLRARGYEVDLAEDGRTALELAARSHPDVVVLDLGLPELDGVEVIRGLRGWSRVPIVVLSVRDAERDKVAALDAGADDYVTKPFGMDELLARLRAALRRAAPAEEAATVETPDFVIDLAAKRVVRDGAEIRLTPTEWHLVEVLVRNRGRLVTQRQLLQEVWGPEYGEETNYLRVYMAQVRRKLEPEPSQPRYFITEPGMGYRFET